MAGVDARAPLDGTTPIVAAGVHAAVLGGFASVLVAGNGSGRPAVALRAARAQELEGAAAERALEQVREVQRQELEVIGQVPADLNGLYVRIGPNPMKPPKAPRYHWFTGDGMVQMSFTLPLPHDKRAEGWADSLVAAEAAVDRRREFLERGRPADPFRPRFFCGENDLRDLIDEAVKIGAEEQV